MSRRFREIRGFREQDDKREDSWRDAALPSDY
jgi:hypothetical protein